MTLPYSNFLHTHPSLIAQGSKLQGQTLCHFITSLTSDPSIFYYSKFVPSASIEALKTSHPKYYNLFDLFCFGDYLHYLSDTSIYPVLTADQITKLRQLSLLSICNKSVQVSLSLFLSTVNLSNIECVKLLMGMMEYGVIGINISESKGIVRIFNSVNRDVKLDSKDDLLNMIDSKILNNQKLIKSLKKQISKFGNDDAVQMEVEEYTINRPGNGNQPGTEGQKGDKKQQTLEQKIEHLRRLQQANKDDEDVL